MQSPFEPYAHPKSPKREAELGNVIPEKNPIIKRKRDFLVVMRFKWDHRRWMVVESDIQQNT